MPLTTINAAKEQALSYQPLIVAKFVWPDGTILRASTHPLSVAQGGAQYDGQDWLAIIDQKDIAAIQAMSPSGIDVPTDVSIHLNDPSDTIWTGYGSKGWRGVKLTLRFIYCDVSTWTFSEDYIDKFSGVCSMPSRDGARITVSAVGMVNMQKSKFPQVLCQQRCPWAFPANAAQRADSVRRQSPFYRCGYNPAGGRGTGSFTDCPHTKEGCKERGMYDAPIGAFGGITYQLPPGSYRSRQYTNGETLTLRADSNDAKYGEPFPEVYGTAWVQARVMNIFPEGNTIRGEAVVCVGEVENILDVVVNDTRLTAATSIDGSPYYVPKGGEVLRYNVINRGDRVGAPNEDVPYNGNGDPYGSLCAILWVLPRDQAGGSTPQVWVKVMGPRLVVPNTADPADQESWPYQYTDNPAWVALDLMVRAGWRYEQLNIQSFIDAAAFCDQNVSYTDQNGDAATRKRYVASLVLTRRRPAGEVLRAFLRGFNATIVPDGNGKHRLMCRSTLGEQQKTAPAGTNWTDALSSNLATGAAASGYVAYRFTPANMIRRDGRLVRLLSRANGDIANKVVVRFADPTLDYAESGISLVDSEDIALVGSENESSIEAIGIAGYGQAHAVSQTFLAEQLRGNHRGDTKGTEAYEWQTTAKGIRLNAGDIVLVVCDELGMDGGTLVRLTKVSYSSNGELVTLQGTFHRDTWYVDGYSPSTDPTFMNGQRNKLVRPALPWGPYEEQTRAASPAIDSKLYDPTEWTFKLEPRVGELGDGAAGLVLRITGKKPVNTFSTSPAPLLKPQGSSATTGGTIRGGSRRYYVHICGTDSDGRRTAPSNPAHIDITTAGNAHTVTVQVVSWGEGSTGYVAFIGLNPNDMNEVASAAGTPATITLTEYPSNTRNMPDSEFDSAAAIARVAEHAGVWGQEVDAVGAGFIQILEAGWTADEWQGRDVMLVWKADGSPLPVRVYRVTSNDADKLYLNPDPQEELVQGDVVVMMSTPTVSGRTLSDSKWVNSLSGEGAGLEPGEEAGRAVLFVSGPGDGAEYPIESNDATSITVARDFDVQPTSESRYIIVRATPQAEQRTGSIDNADPAAVLQLDLPVENLRRNTVYVQALMVDGGGNRSVAALSPGRVIYLPGEYSNFRAKARTITADATLSDSDQVVDVDSSAGDVVLTFQTAAKLHEKSVRVRKISDDANTITVQGAGSDGIPGATTITSQWECRTWEADGKTGTWKPVAASSLAGGPGGGDSGWYDIPFASTVTPNIDNGVCQKLVVTGECTINAPIRTAGDRVLKLKVVNGGSGGYAVTFAAGWKLPGWFDHERTLNTYSSLDVSLDDSGVVWHNTNPSTGLPI
jgi:hypothetical protein